MAKPGKLQTFLEYSAAKSVLAGFGLLPAPAAMAARARMGKLAYAIAGDLRRTGAINLRLAFPKRLKKNAALLLARMLR
jgi:lauroyl/myristoyl acyltransferase